MYLHILFGEHSVLVFLTSCRASEGWAVSSGDAGHPEGPSAATGSEGGGEDFAARGIDNGADPSLERINGYNRVIESTHYLD